jgi:hypothetical protein
MKSSADRFEAELVALLRSEAQSLDTSALNVAENLNTYASRIADHAQSEAALVQFDRYAHHHRGLIDTLVPGVDMATWRTFVHAARRLSRLSVRRRGLDNSIVGRLFAIAKGFRRAP